MNASQIYGDRDMYVAIIHVETQDAELVALRPLCSMRASSRELGAAAAYEAFLIWDRATHSGRGWGQGTRGLEGLIGLATGEGAPCLSSVSIRQHLTLCASQPGTWQPTSALTAILGGRSESCAPLPPLHGRSTWMCGRPVSGSIADAQPLTPARPSPACSSGIASRKNGLIHGSLSRPTTAASARGRSTSLRLDRDGAAVAHSRQTTVPAARL